MAMIRKMGFVDYFLIVSDFIGYAKAHGIPVGPGRGSAAGSMVAYCLDITDVDPMKYSLYFERFLNPERVTMPDIDIDFCYRRAAGGHRLCEPEVRRRPRGPDRHLRHHGRQGRHPGRGPGPEHPLCRGGRHRQAVRPGALHITLEALKLSKQLQGVLRRGRPQVKKAHRHRQGHRGHARHASTHAAGVVITSRPVDDYVPLAKNDGLWSPSTS